MSLIKRPADEESMQLTKRARSTDLITQQGTIKRTSAMEAPIMLLTGHGAEVTTFRFSPKGDICASGSHDKTIFLWNVYGNCENTAVLKSHKQAVLQVQFNSDASWLWSCSADKTAMLWDLESLNRIKKLSDHKAIVNSICPSRRGPPLAVTGSDDSTAKTFDARCKHAVKSYDCTYPVTAVSFAEQGELVFTGGVDNTIKVWDCRKDDVLYTLDGHSDTITSLALSPDATHLLSNSMDNTLRIFDVRPFFAGNDRCTKVFKGHQHGQEKNLVRAAWDPVATRVGCGSADRMVYVWDVQTTKLVYKLPGHAGVVDEVDFHPKEPIIGSCATDKKIFLGELEAM